MFSSCQHHLFWKVFITWSIRNNTVNTLHCIKHSGPTSLFSYPFGSVISLVPDDNFVFLCIMLLPSAMPAADGQLIKVIVVNSVKVSDSHNVCCIYRKCIYNSTRNGLSLSVPTSTEVNMTSWGVGCWSRLNSAFRVECCYIGINESRPACSMVSLILCKEYNWTPFYIIIYVSYTFFK